jgi:hypothetical protein
MNKLDKNGIRFFRRELLDETNRQLELFETSAPKEIASREFGRIKLYDDRHKIERHFVITSTEVGGYETNHPFHALLGPLEGSPGSSILVWKEIEGIRHELNAEIQTQTVWKETTPPEVRLTLTGEVIPKKRHESLS